MFKHRNTASELMDDAKLSGVALAQNLTELAATNRWFGSRSALIKALDHLLKQSVIQKTLVVADLGCGSGDLLRSIFSWAEKKNLSLSLVGIDINPFIIQFAINQSLNFPEIQFQTIDIFSHEFSALRFDIVTLNSFCHHLSDKSLVKLLVQLKLQTREAIIINDLQRHPISFYTIKWLSKLLRFSVLAQHDGPLSVLRAFRKQELLYLLQQADIVRFRLKWRWAFRWQLIIYCNQVE